MQLLRRKSQIPLRKHCVYSTLFIVLFEFAHENPVNNPPDHSFCTISRLTTLETKLKTSTSNLF